jgi:hypothetical protein
VRHDWSKLTHATGSAAKVPSHAALLTSDDEHRRRQVLGGLRGTLVGEACWYDSAGPAVNLLLSLVDGELLDADRVFGLVADIVGADHTRAWLTAPEEAAEDGEARAAVVVHRATVVGALESPDPARRAGATLLAALLPELDLVAALERMAFEDDDEVARASALLGLARFDASPVLDPPASGIAKGAAGLAALRAGIAGDYDAVGDELALWLGYAPTGEETIPWFRSLRPQPWFRALWGPDNTARALVALARQRGDEDALVEHVIALAERSGDPQHALSAAKIALELGGFGVYGERPPPRVDVFDKLTEPQQAMARRLAQTWLLPAGGFGLPAAGASRRRWAGLEPARALQQSVAIDGATEPAFTAIARTRGPALPALDALEPLERYEAWVELCALSYPPTSRHLSPEQLEEKLVELEAPGRVACAERLADELAERFRHAEAQRAPRTPTFAMTALLLLPILRAGRPLDPSWAVLLHLGKQPQIRELFAALSPERREARLYEYLAGHRDPYATVSAVLHLADMAPSTRLFELVDRTIEALVRKPLPPVALEPLQHAWATLRAAHPDP